MTNAVRSYGKMASVTLCAFALSSCDKSGSFASSDVQLIQLNGARTNLENKISVARLKLDRAQRQIQETDVAKSRLDKLTSRQIQLNDRISEVEQEIASMSDSMRLLKARYLETSRKLAIGKEFPSLRTASGRSYDQAKIVDVTDAGIQICHSTGTARLAFQDLTEDQRHQFGLDEGLAVTALAAESSQLRTYERQIDAQLARQSESRPRLPVEISVPTASLLKAAHPISAFDRFVSLGSTSTRPSRVVARYNRSHRSTRYHYYYLSSRPCPPPAVP